MITLRIDYDCQCGRTIPLGVSLMKGTLANQRSEIECDPTHCPHCDREIDSEEAMDESMAALDSVVKYQESRDTADDQKVEWKRDR